MTKICPNCHYIGKGNFSKFYNDWMFGSVYSGISIIVVGSFYAFFRRPGTDFDIYFSLLAILFALFGVFCIVQYYRGGSYCPKCNDTPMLKLDSPEAIELIKQHDLKISKGTSEESSKQST